MGLLVKGMGKMTALRWGCLRLRGRWGEHRVGVRRTVCRLRGGPWPRLCLDLLRVGAG